MHRYRFEFLHEFVKRLRHMIREKQPGCHILWDIFLLFHCFVEYLRSFSMKGSVSASCSIDGNTMSAPAFRNSSGGTGPVVTAMVNAPALAPASTPKGAFSMTIHSHGSALASAMALRYGSG